MSITGRRLVQDPAGVVQVEEYTVPDPAADQILVGVTVTQVSAGSEMNGVRRRRNASEAERSQFRTTPMGYTAVGRVEAVGSAELWVAFTACMLVLVAMVVHVFRTVVAPTSSASSVRDARFRG